MTVTDSRRQGKTAAQIQADVTNWINNQTVTQRCLFCPWTWKGTAEEGRQHALQHRATAHPDTAQTNKRHRKLTGLDTPEKLADARAKGTHASRPRPHR